jgi:hypothetical protein
MIKKYKGKHLCECAVGFNAKWHQVILCKNKATLLFTASDRPTVSARVCESCWDNGKLEERMSRQNE